MKRSSLLLCALLTVASLSPVAARTRLVVLNDTHVSPGYHTENGLKAAVKDIPSVNPDAVVFNGDLTNEGSDVELQYIKAIIDEIQLPVYVNPGNHENTWSQSAGRTYLEIFGTDRFQGVVGEDSIIIIGTNCGPYMRMGDGHVKQEDLHWLKTTLDSLTASHPDSRVLSFNHYALNPDLDNYLDYIEFLKPYPVLAHVNGHYHINRLENIEGQGDLRDITLTCLDRKNGEYGYSIIDITSDSINVFTKKIGQPEEKLFGFMVPEKVRFKKVPENWIVENAYTDSASIFTRPAISEGVMYYGTSNGLLKALELTSGNVKWQKEIGASLYGLPLVVDNALYVPTTNQGLLKIDKTDGSLLKQFVDSLPIVADGLVSADNGRIYLGGYGKIAAYDTKKDRQVWQFTDIANYCQGQPALAGNNLVFGAWDSYLRNIDPRNGKLKWKWNNGKSSNILGPGNVVPVISGNRIVIVAPDRYMTMIDLNSGKTIWRDNSVKYRESLGTNADATIAYAKTMDGELIAVDMTKDVFTPLWKTDLNIGYEHAPCPIIEVDGYIYAGSRRGIISVLDADSGKLLANIDLGSSEVNGFAPVSGMTAKEGYAIPVGVSLIEGKVAIITPPAKH